MDLGLASIIASIIVAIGGIVVSIICVAIPRQRKDTIDKLRKELYDVYKDVEQLKQVEESLEQQLGVSKQVARKDVVISERLESARLTKRINQLEKQIS